MDINRIKYVKKARLIASMINMHRTELKIVGDKSQQHFWLHWAARHGKRLKSSKIFYLKYRSSIEHFAVIEFLLFLIVLFSFTYCMQ